MPKLPVNASFSRCRPCGYALRPVRKPATSCRLFHVSASLAQDDIPAVRVIDARSFAASPQPRTLRITRVDPYRLQDKRTAGTNGIRNATPELRSTPLHTTRTPFVNNGSYRTAETRRSPSAGLNSGPGRRGPGRPSTGSFSGGRPKRRGERGGGKRDGPERSSGEEKYTVEGMLQASTGELKTMLGQCRAAERAGTPRTTRPKAFEIAEVSFETLAGNGPAISLGQWGMGELVGDKLDRIAGDYLIENAVRIQELTRRLRNGDFVRFRDDMEKEAVIDLARILDEKKAQRPTGDVEEKDIAVTAFEPISKEARNTITTTVLQGSYKLAEKDPGFLQELLIKVRRNETISPRQEDALVRKIRNLMPLQIIRSARMQRSPS